MRYHILICEDILLSLQKQLSMFRKLAMEKG